MVQIILGIALATLLIAGATPVQLDIKYRVGNAPMTTRARIIIEPDERNRHLCLHWTNTANGDGRTSCQSLDGAAAPKVFWQDLKDLSAGEWEVVAALVRTEESKLSNRISLIVTGIQ